MPTLSYNYFPIWSIINHGEPYNPLQWQVEHVHSKVDAGFKVICLACGRRSGKTTAMLAEVVRAAFQPPKRIDGVLHFPVIYICGPNHELAGRIFDPVWDMFVPDKRGEFLPPLHDMYLNHDKNAGIIWLKNGAKISRKTGDDPRSMQGERVTAAFVEETQDFNEDAWKMLLPALIDSQGILFCIGVPWGRSRWLTLFELGRSKQDGYYSASVPTTANPSITDEMLVKLSQGMTEIEIKAHLYAEWVKEYGAVFRNPDEIFDAEEDGFIPGPEKGHSYVIGVDIGKMYDYTVTYVMDVSTMDIVARDRYNHMDYTIAAEKVAGLAANWHADVVSLDATGGGEVFADILRSMGVPVRPYVFTMESKQVLVTTLVKAVEQKMIHVQRDDEILRTELRLFEGKLVTTSSGTRIDYSHPSGGHDDCVMALALATIVALPYRQGNLSTIVRKPYVSFRKNSVLKDRYAGRRRPLSPV